MISLNRTDTAPMPWNQALAWAGLLALILGLLSCLKYLSFHATYTDLGLFLGHLSKDLLHEPWRFLAGHVIPFSLLWSLFAGVFTGDGFALFLLSAQALTIALPVAWILRAYGLLPGLAYGLYFPIWYNGLFDFHVDHLLLPLLTAFFLLERRGRIGWAVVIAMLVMLVKEPYALESVGCGLYLLWRRHGWAGLLVILVAGFYFILAAQYILPYITLGATGAMVLNSSAYSWLGNSLGEMVRFLLFQPHRVLGEILSDPQKLLYLGALLGALAFLPLVRPAPLLVGLPILAVSLLAKYPGYYALGHQYTAGLVVPLVVAFAQALPPVEAAWRRWRGADRADWRPALLLVLIASHILLAPSPLGRLFWSDKAWGYHHQAYVTGAREEMMRQALLTHIPAEASVVVSTQNSVISMHLAQRDLLLPFPAGVFEPAANLDGGNRSLPEWWSFVRQGQATPARFEPQQADFVVLDMQRPWYLLDQGCDWLYGKCRDEEKARTYLETVRRLESAFTPVFQQDGFRILRRNGT